MACGNRCCGGGGILITHLPGYASTLYICPYFIFGVYFSKYQISKSKWWNMIYMCATALWLLMMCFFGRAHYIYITGIDRLIRSGEGTVAQQFLIDTFRYAIGAFGVLAMWGGFERVFGWIEKTKCARVICAVGQNTIQIYLIQRILLENFLTSFFRENSATGLLRFINENVIFLNLVSTVLAVLLLFIIHIMAEIIKQNRVINRVLFGGR